MKTNYRILARQRTALILSFTLSTVCLVAILCFLPIEVKHAKDLWGSEGRWSEQRISALAAELRSDIPEKGHAVQINRIVGRLEYDAKTIKWRTRMFFELMLAFWGVALLLWLISWRFWRHLRQCSVNEREHGTEQTSGGDSATRVDTGLGSPQK